MKGQTPQLFLHKVAFFTKLLKSKKKKKRVKKIILILKSVQKGHMLACTGFSVNLTQHHGCVALQRCARRTSDPQLLITGLLCLTKTIKRSTFKWRLPQADLGEDHPRQQRALGEN